MSGGFRIQQPGLKKLLGDLEAEIMERVWARPVGDRVAVRDVYEALRAERSIAYTTVMTVMGNLAKKGVLGVERSGAAYLYYAKESREAFTEREVGKIIDGLMSDFSEAAVAHFAQALQDPGKQDVLARLRERIEDAQSTQPTE